MPCFPIEHPSGLIITSITRSQSEPPASNLTYQSNGINRPIQIDISVATSNLYIVTGSNLNQIQSVNWYPAKRDQIKFNMVPWRTYLPVSIQATFGIIVTNNFTFDYQRGGSISFRLLDSSTLSIPAETYFSWPWSFNPVVEPLQGWDTGWVEGRWTAHIDSMKFYIISILIAILFLIYIITGGVI